MAELEGGKQIIEFYDVHLTVDLRKLFRLLLLRSVLLTVKINKYKCHVNTFSRVERGKGRPSCSARECWNVFIGKKYGFWERMTKSICLP